MSLSATLFLMLCGVAIGLGPIFLTPLRFYENYILTSLISLPLSGAIIFLLLQKNPVWPFRQDLKTDPRGDGQNATPAFSENALYLNRILCLIAITLFCATLALGLNQWLDQSETSQKSFIIIGKNVTVHKGSYTYHIAIQSPIDSPIPSIDFGGVEDIHIRSMDYNRVIPGQSEITLNIAPGFFHISWYKGSYSFSGLASSSTPSTTINNLPPPEVLQQACQWRNNFNVDSEIEKIAPDDYHRDFWPGGEPRSVEPLVHGQNHGIGHYTFANGQVYGDIPWKHGQKHGVFTLYREDGSREQTLSYKDGHIYGISEWFNPNGSLSVTWLYLNEQSYFPISVCNNIAGTAKTP